MTEVSIGLLILVMVVAMTAGVLIGVIGLRMRRYGVEPETPKPLTLRRRGWAADVPIVGMPATPDFDIPVPGATRAEALREPPEPGNLFDPTQSAWGICHMPDATATPPVENRQPRNIRLRDHDER